MGKKKKQLEICKECSKSNRPAINAATLGHEECLVSAYRVLGVFNERDDIGSTPIHYAARNGRLECLQWLVKHSGISPIAVTRSGTTAAHDAAATGYLSCLQYLLEETKCSVWDKTNEGATVLHMACRFGHVGATRWLLERGSASPGEKGANGVTPVHLCAAKSKFVYSLCRIGSLGLYLYDSLYNVFIC